MIEWFAGLPVRTKLKALVAGTLALALLMSGVVFVSYDRARQLDDTVSAMEALAQVTAQRSQAALAFNDSRRALENLQGLAPVRDIVSACAFSERTAEPLAQWARRDTVAPVCLRSPGQKITAEQFVVAVAVQSPTGVLGVLTLAGTYQSLERRLRYLMLSLLAIGSACVVLALWMTRPFQRMLYRPIIELAAVARQVEKGVDFRVRAVKHSADEVGDAVDAFNAMLVRLEEDKLALEKLAYHDTLTGLPNRRLFMEKLARAIAHSRMHDLAFGLIFIDLDNFKWVNDTLGHDRGDWLLKVVAERTQSAVRSMDTVARLGGDEFTVILLELEDQAEGEALCRAILDAFQPPVMLGTHAHQAGASLGLAVCDGYSVSIDGALKQADLAVYQAKAAGKNTYRVYQPGPD